MGNGGLGGDGGAGGLGVEAGNGGEGGSIGQNFTDVSALGNGGKAATAAPAISARRCGRHFLGRERRCGHSR